jgi:hypothetical protein
LAFVFVGSSVVHADADVEAIVRATFADAPVMVRVAQCESGFRQFDSSGAVLHGGTNNQMIGVFQLYDSVHRQAAAALGFNIDTILGNVSYARYLYDQEGTDPWMSSFPCWNDNTTDGSVLGTTTQAVAAPVQTITTATAPTLTEALSFGMVDPQVLVLQQLLNAAGFTITTSGPGAPGQETTKFGLLTRDAVRRFQCAKGIACSGDEYSTGYGYVGPHTRSVLLALSQNTTPVATNATTSPAAATSTVDNSAQIASIKQQIADLQARLMQLEAGSQ